MKKKTDDFCSYVLNIFSLGISNFELVLKILYLKPIYFDLVCFIKLILFPFCK